MTASRGVGRPRGEPYTTITTRLPISFAQQIRARIEEESITLSQFIRESLEQRIRQERPIFVGMACDVIPIPTRACEQEPSTHEDVLIEAEQVAAIHAQNVVIPIPSVALPEGYALGKICPRQHIYGQTLQTIRKMPGSRCMQCEAEQKRAKRARK